MRWPPITTSISPFGPCGRSTLTTGLRAGAESPSRASAMVSVTRHENGGRPWTIDIRINNSSDSNKNRFQEMLTSHAA
jgi:uncharacterized Ntn-hydrolase superfamily protein